MDSAPVCAERFRFYDNSGDTGEKITRLRKTIGGFAAVRSPLSLPNGLDFMITPVIRVNK